MHDSLSTLIIGGTSGIGAGLASALAERSGPIIVVGRDLSAAESLGTRYTDFQAIRADLSSVREVDELASRLAAESAPLDRLIFTAGILSGSTRATAEGNEVSFVVNHVARRRLTEALLPRLAKASALGRRATLGYITAWPDYKSPVDDFEAFNAAAGGGLRASMRTYLLNDPYFAEVAERHPDLRVVAFNPGPTRGTRLAHRSHAPLLLKIMSRVVFPFIASDLDETAERFAHHLDGEAPGLHFFAKTDAKPIPPVVNDAEQRAGARAAAASVRS